MGTRWVYCEVAPEAHSWWHHCEILIIYCHCPLAVIKHFVFLVDWYSGWGKTLINHKVFPAVICSTTVNFSFNCGLILLCLVRCWKKIASPVNRLRDIIKYIIHKPFCRPSSTSRKYIFIRTSSFKEGKWSQVFQWIG